MTPSKTERELEELLRAATPLPWWSRDDGVYGPDGDGVAEVFGNAAHLVHAEGNGALIVAAVNALPDLLAERKRPLDVAILAQAIQKSHDGGIPIYEGLTTKAYTLESPEEVAEVIANNYAALLAEQEATDE